MRSKSGISIYQLRDLLAEARADRGHADHVHTVLEVLQRPDDAGLGVLGVELQSNFCEDLSFTITEKALFSWWKTHLRHY